MSRLQKFALAMIVLGGAMTSLGNLWLHLFNLSEFLAGFLTGMSIVMIILGVILLFKGKQTPNQEKEKEKEQVE